MIKQTLLGWRVKEENIPVYISGVLFGMLFMILISRSCIKEARLKKSRDAHSRYTIGVTGKRLSHNFRSSVDYVDYYYKYKGALYKRTQSFPFFKQINANGGRYFVQFAEDDPGNSEMFLDKPVPDIIKLAPWRMGRPAELRRGSLCHEINFSAIYYGLEWHQ